MSGTAHFTRSPASPRARHRSPVRRPGGIAVIALLVALALATTAAAGTVGGSSRGLTATLHAGTHHPEVGRRWPIQFTATRSGRAVRATVTYEYVYGGQVVARRAQHTFTGRFSDALVFPAQSVGYPLTFRGAVTSGGSTVNLDYAIQVSR